MDTYAVAAKEKKCPAKALRKASLTGCKIRYACGVLQKT